MFVKPMNVPRTMYQIMHIMKQNQREGHIKVINSRRRMRENCIINKKKQDSRDQERKDRRRPKVETLNSCSGD